MLFTITCVLDWTLHQSSYQHCEPARDQERLTSSSLSSYWSDKTTFQQATELVKRSTQRLRSCTYISYMHIGFPQQAIGWAICNVTDWIRGISTAPGSATPVPCEAPRVRQASDILPWHEFQICWPYWDMSCLHARGTLAELGKIAVSWLYNESVWNVWSQVGTECAELKSREMGKSKQSATFLVSLLGRASEPCRCQKHWAAYSKTGKFLLAWAVFQRHGIAVKHTLIMRSMKNPWIHTSKQRTMWLWHSRNTNQELLNPFKCFLHRFRLVLV